MEELNLDIADTQAKIRKLQRGFQLMNVLKNISRYGVLLLVLGPMLSSFFGARGLLDGRVTSAFIFLQAIFGNFGVIFGVICLILIIIFSFGEAGIKKRYFNRYKQLLGVEGILRSFFDDVSYSPVWGMTREEFDRTGVFYAEGGNYRSEDLITAAYQGIGFQQSDINIYTWTGSKNKTKVTYVDGRVVKFHYKKEIQGKILIASKGFIPKSASAFANGKPIYTQKEKIKELSMISMEDTDFNNKFTVYTNNPHSAYYFLTPHVMEYIKGLWGMDSKVSISFDGEYLSILRSGSGGIFEPPLHGTINVAEQVRVIRQELQEIVRCIEALRLDERQEREEVLEEALQREQERLREGQE